MEGKLCGQTDADSYSGTQNNQNCGVKSLRNISVQTGEEFLDEFLRDRVASRRVPVANNADQSKPVFDVVQNHQVISLHGTRTRESESSPDYRDFSSGDGYGFDVNSKTYVEGSSAYYRELQANGQHQRKFSENLDRSGPSGPPAYSSESPLSNQCSSIGSGGLDGSLSGKLKFLCSFGGKILPRPNDGKLRYVGGDTRIISIWKNVSYLELLRKTMAVCNYHHTIKYQLPGEDLDALISVSSDEDLHHMIEEYHDLEKISQRLRLFLIASGDLEGPYSSEGRTVQQGDADHPYVVAVNGMADPIPQRSFSRDSLESQWVNNVDSPTLQMEPPSPFRHLENQNGGGSLNTTWTMSIPSGQVFSTPQVPPTTYVQTSPLSHVQYTDPNASYMKGYEDLQSPYAYTNNCSYIMDIPANGNPCCFDASGYYQNHLVGTLAVMDSSNQNSHMAQAHATTLVGSHSRMPSKDFQPTSPYAPSFADARIGFPNVPLHSEKLVPSQDSLSFSPVTGVHANSYWIETNLVPEPQPTNEEGRSVSLEQEMEKPSWAFAAEKLPPLEMCGSSQEVGEEQKTHEKDQISRNKEQVDFIEWGEDMTTSMKNDEASFDPDREKENYAIENNYALNVDLLEHKKNLPQIICRPDSQLCLHVPKSELQVNGSKNSSSSFNSAEYPEDFWKELSGNSQISSNEPEFLIKSQKGNSDLKHLAPHATDCNTAIFGSHMLQPVSARGNNQSQFFNPVLLPDKSGVGLCLTDHLAFPETNVNCALDGEASLQKEVVKNSYENLMKCSHDSVKKENPDINSLEDLNIRNGTFVNSQYPDNCHKPSILKDPVKVEDMADSLQREVPSSSTNTTHRPDEHSEEVESPGDTPGTESHLSEIDHYDVEVDEGTKDESLSEAAIIEMEASIYGLQIIRNTDLEDLQELGSGTFGTVYHGKWRGTDVAIKRIKKSCFAGRSSEQEKLAKDFWREAKILSGLHHPNIVAFYGVVPDGPGGTLATVTEYLVNGSLRHVLLRKDRSLDRRRKVIIALDAAFGMEYLHLKSIVHFDLKCDNLLVNLGDPHRPVCKVGDFGLSRIKRNTLVSGGVRGTLPWMAPELLNGNSSRVSEKVDVFSFGIAMWEIWTGEEPYVNMHCGAIIGGIVSNSLRPPVPERCDPEWRKLMEHCWSHEPEARPSFSEVARRLQGMSKAIIPKRVNRVKR
ncbi:PB1 domain-containing protein tyrosine kinase [Perilla frutescens var. hirtella]|uniref:PB1 domain-containing protein tyrosine kinase n=1 Tax=Perilla frutescens var. hirtella TaxID=608512 RepID=A0AAD4PCU5_PERFH|nr:PB1 domain-containing protein tyrosine kinase [Perilla frutescens var. hirtella]